jgi:sRNA-binding protein
LKLAIQIAAGIVMAAAFIGIGRYVVLQAQLHAALSAAQQMHATIQRETAEIQARVQAQQAERQRKADETKRAQLEANAAQIRAQSDVARAEQEAAARKAAAWDAFYRPAKKCENPSDWDTQVACGNAHIRAQREFEDRWAQVTL